MVTTSYLWTWEKLLHHAQSGGMLRFVTGWISQMPGNQYFGRHSHPTIELVYHPTGTGVTAIEHGEPISFGEGGVVVYAPHENHDQRMEDAGEDFCLHLDFPGKVALPLGALAIERVENSVVRAEMEALATGPQPARASEQSIFDCRVTAVLLTLLSQVLHPEPEQASGELRVRRAEKYMRENFVTIDSLREVSDYVGVGPDHLRHLFQQLRRRTLVRYLNEVRVARASSLLAVSELPAKEIARQCGFRDVYYFSVVFSRLKGTSPGRFRRQHQLDQRARIARLERKRPRRAS